jgi:hypothetical protein
MMHSCIVEVERAAVRCVACATDTRYSCRPLSTCRAWSGGVCQVRGNDVTGVTSHWHSGTSTHVTTTRLCQTMLRMRKTGHGRSIINAPAGRRRQAASKTEQFSVVPVTIGGGLPVLMDSIPYSPILALVRFLNWECPI